MGVIVDTCIWIDVERGTISPADVARYTGEEPVFISPVSIAELAYGSENAPTQPVGSPRELPPAAPTDPDVQISRIRLLGLRPRCDAVDAVNDSYGRQRVALQQPSEAFPDHLGSR